MDEQRELLKIENISTPETRRVKPGHKGANPAVFIDRDGVINKDMADLGDFADVEILRCVPEAVRGFRTLGLKIVVVTNQGGIGYGLFDEEQFEKVMARIADNIGGVLWDRVYFSPFHESARIEKYRGPNIDRKPNPGMLLRAALDLDLDLERSWMIGDHLKDIEAGHRAGCRCILVSTGRGKKEIRRLVEEKISKISQPDIIVQDLYYAYLALKEELDEGSDS
jgi:D-glycero-D-manno-heptose 1,7-bisphosphate phosphatase